MPGGEKADKKQVGTWWVVWSEAPSHLGWESGTGWEIGSSGCLKSHLLGLASLPLGKPLSASLSFLPRKMGVLTPSSGTGECLRRGDVRTEQGARNLRLAGGPDPTQGKPHQDGLRPHK